MTTITEHVYTARVPNTGGDIVLSLDEDAGGDVTLDAAAIPHVQSAITVAVEDPLLLEDLDPRDSRRVVLTATRVGGASRTFDLGIRKANPDRAGGTVTLRLASDEAILMDYAQLVDDNGPRAFQASLRAVCNYVLGKIGAALQAGGPDADVTAIWGVKNLFPDPSVENAAPAFAADVAAPNVVRDGNQYAPPYLGSYLLRVQATATGGLSIGQITPMGVRAGAWYTGSAYLRSYAGNTKQARIIVRWTGPAGNFIRDEQSAYVMTSATAWTRWVLTARAPAGASGARIFIEWAGPHAAGNLHFVDGVMFHEGTEAIPLFTGGTAPDVYTYAWEKDANASASTRTPSSVERLPESLLWRAGISGMAFLEPLLKAAGLRLVCDEQRRWTLRAASYRADGIQTYRHAVNIETADEELSREDDAWYDAAVYVYTWTDSSGIEQTRTDAFALTTPPTKVMRVELTDTVYPGPGRAENIVRRAQGRGRTVAAGAIPTWEERTDQYVSVLLEGTPIQTGLASTVRFDLGTDTVTVSARTVDTPAGAIDLLPGTINALPGTINSL